MRAKRSENVESVADADPLPHDRLATREASKMFDDDVPAQASTSPVCDAVIPVHFDLAKQQMPENIALEPHRSHALLIFDTDRDGAAGNSRVNLAGRCRVSSRRPPTASARSRAIGRPIPCLPVASA